LPSFISSGLNIGLWLIKSLKPSLINDNVYYFVIIP